MKKIFLLIISFLIGIGLFIWMGKIVGWQQIKNSFLVFTGWQGLVIFGLTLLAMIIAILRWKEILKGEEVKTSFRELFRPYLSGFAIMFLAPVLLGAGEIFMAYTIKAKKQITFAKSMASVIIDRILEWTANLIVIFLGVLFFFYKIGLPPKNLLIASGTVFLIFLSGILLFYFKIYKRESITKTFGKIFSEKLSDEPLDTEKEIFNFFKVQKKPMWTSFMLTFLKVSVMYIRAWFLVIFLGKTISALPVLSILGFNYLAAMVPIPTALGSHEALQIFAFESLNLGASTATAFTTIIRAAQLIFALTGLMFLFRSGISFLFKKSLANELKA